MGGEGEAQVITIQPIMKVFRIISKRLKEHRKGSSELPLHTRRNIHTLSPPPSTAGVWCTGSCTDSVFLQDLWSFGAIRPTNVDDDDTSVIVVIVM
jgi:hypothetical protein